MKNLNKKNKIKKEIIAICEGKILLLGLAVQYKIPKSKIKDIENSQKKKPLTL